MKDGPNLIYRADLDIYQPGYETDPLNHVEREVYRDLRCSFFRRQTHSIPVEVSLAAQFSKLLSQPFLAPNKEQHKVEVTGRIRRNK